MKRRWPRPDIATFWQVASIGVGLMASLLMARGSLLVTPETVASSAGTYWDRNPHVVRSLAEQAADGQAGLFLLVLSVVFGLAALTSSEHRPTATSKTFSWVLAIALSLVCGVSAFRWAVGRADTLVRAATALPAETEGGAR